MDVFRLLVTAGSEGMLSGEIGKELGIRQNTMSANLAIMLNAGIIRNRREGRSIRYFADLTAYAVFWATSWRTAVAVGLNFANPSLMKLQLFAEEADQ